MSEDREESENGWLSFVLSAVHPDYDIVWRVREDMIEGISPASLNTLANRNGYGHVISNEAASAAGKYDGVDKEAFLKSWRLKKRQDIMSGEYSTSTRGGPRGPRLSELEQEERAVAILELKARWNKSNDPKDFPKTGKGLINKVPVDQLIKLVLERMPQLKANAAANVAARKAEEEAAQARLASTDDAFADLMPAA